MADGWIHCVITCLPGAHCPGALTRRDHVNNVAVHSGAIVMSLHGGKGRLPGGARPSRLAALARDDSGGFLSGFREVDNVGSMVHGIALWEAR